MYGYVPNGTCESHGMTSIRIEKDCKAAAISFDKSTKMYTYQRGDNQERRPTGCSWHEHGNLELWANSYGVCDVNGYGGCFCIKPQGI